MIIDRKYTGFPEGVGLNEMQQLYVPHMDDRVHPKIVCAKTSSGKSTLITMGGSKYIEDGDDSMILYVGSMKALVEEKKADWDDPNHPWYELPKAVVTGDYATDSAILQKKLEKARLVTITPESLASRLRKIGLNQWLHRVRFVVFDEFHLIGEDQRGANMEVCVMEVTRVLPNAELLMLSATVPNDEDMTAWLALATKKTPTIIKSDYRPVPLEYVWIPVPSGKTEATENWRIDHIVRLVTSADKAGEQFLVGVFKKAFGDRLLDALRRAGVAADFHNADRTKQVRDRIEAQFRSKEVRVLVSTSTLFTGVNLPARNVIVTGVTIGQDDIQAMVLNQLAGRAGRKGLDDQGTVYFYVPKSAAAYHETRIVNGEPVNSRLLSKGALATHFLGAVYTGAVSDPQTFHEWYQRSLAAVQGHLSQDSRQRLLDGVVNDLIQFGMLEPDTRMYKLKRRGAITAQMMMDPYYSFELIMNWRKFRSKIKQSDLDLAMVFGETSLFYSQWIDERKKAVIEPQVRAAVSQEYWEGVQTYLMRIRDEERPYPLRSSDFKVYNDLDRTEQTMLRYSAESERWGDEELIGAAFQRIRYGYDWNQARFSVARLRKSEVKLLQGYGISTIEELRANPRVAQAVLPATRLLQLGVSV